MVLLPLFMAMKARTPHEMDEEKFALEALRGDFDNIKSVEQAKRADAGS